MTTTLTVKSRWVVVAAASVTCVVFHKIHSLYFSVEMNNSKLLHKILRNYRQKSAESFRNFHGVQVLNSGGWHAHLLANSKYDSPLFFTHLPHVKRQRRVREVPEVIRSGKLVIQCKRKELNHYSGMQYGKFHVVPLASKGWNHSKSVGDKFTILPVRKYSPFSNDEDQPGTFEECGIREDIIKQLTKANIETPTDVQVKVLQKLIAGGNLFMFSECGSGKTVAYIISVIQNALYWKESTPGTVNSPSVIIIVASRELAVQVLTMIDLLSRDLGLECQALLDGQTRDLLKNPRHLPVDVLVTTFPALLKHLKAGIYTTKRCKHVIVDDVDIYEIGKKYDMISNFCSRSGLKFTGLNSPNAVQNSAQICFVSAVAPSTLGEKLSSLIELNEVETVSTSFTHRVLRTVPQTFLRVSGSGTPDHLLSIVKRNKSNRIQTVIFSNGNKTCNWAAFFLRGNGVECATLNRKDCPADRMQNFRDFEAGYLDVVSTTNFLSLGIHFPRVQHLINLEFPRFMSDYIHRCGRVGRLGQQSNCEITNFIRKETDVTLTQKIELAVRTNSALPNICCPKVKNG